MKQETKNKLKKAGQVAFVAAQMLPAGRLLGGALKARSAYNTAKAAKKAKQVASYNKYKDNSFRVPGQKKRVRVINKTKNKSW